jgi:hypothetical protein
MHGMKNLLFAISLAFLLLSCDSGNMNEELQKPEKPKIYKVTYDGNENTEGEVPVDDNLYAEGDSFKPAWNYKLRKGLYTFKGWLVKGASLDSDFFFSNEQKNIFFVNYDHGMVVVGTSDISFTAVWDINSIYED